MHKHLLAPVCAAIAMLLLCAAPQVRAQDAAQAKATPPASPTATRFTPVAGDDSVKKLADSLGNTPEERQQILQLAGAGKELFAQKYKGKWNNTLAGAMTFFIASAYTVGNDREPSKEAEERLFSTLNATLAQSDIVRASNAEKTALYNVLLAGAGLPLVFYVDGKQNHNAGQVEQAKKMADGFGQQFLKMDLQAMSGMLGEGANAAATATDAHATMAQSANTKSGKKCVAARMVMVPNYVYAPPMGMQMVQKQALRYVEVPCGKQ
ncbi:MAG: hypothetical protein QM612_02715 [Thermomonas sp.]|uniref:DUF6683 family protein n=1 Tax=Thermomonas sp. TaxID=1971895 RepID=UPI0039E461A5